MRVLRVNEENKVEARQLNLEVKLCVDLDDNYLPVHQASHCHLIHYYNTHTAYSCFKETVHPKILHFVLLINLDCFGASCLVLEILAEGISAFSQTSL